MKVVANTHIYIFKTFSTVYFEHWMCYDDICKQKHSKNNQTRRIRKICHFSFLGYTFLKINFGSKFWLEFTFRNILHSNKFKNCYKPH